MKTTAPTLRKIITVGDSIAVTLPKDLIRSIGLRETEHVSIEVDTVKKVIVLRPVKKSTRR